MKIIVVAPGPSLSEEQLKLIKNCPHTVIAIGDAGRVSLPEADYIYHADAKWWNYYNGCPEATGVLLSHDPTLYTWSLNSSPVAFKYGLGHNSGYQAISIALSLLLREPEDQPKEIILVGFDVQDTNGKHNIIGDHPEKVKRQYDPEAVKKSLESLSEKLIYHGVTVYNCSINSALTVYTKKDLADVI